MIVYVFNESLQRIGIINKYTALQWDETWGESGSFKLWAVLTPENQQLLVKDNLIWNGRDQLGLIEVIKKGISDEGESTIVVSGRFVEQVWVGRRIIWGKLVYVNKKVGAIISDLFNTQVISPKDPRRVIPNVELNPAQTPLGPEVSFTRSYENVWKTIKELNAIGSLDTHLVFNPMRSKLVLKISEGTDLHEVVRISTDLNDILSSEYSEDSSGYVNTALVAGQGQDENRVVTYVNTDNSGLDRREMYVDARDLSQTDEEGMEISLEVYKEMLQNRGDGVLQANPLYREYTATIRTQGKTAYTFEKDYNLGDIISIIDNKIGVTLEAMVKGSKRYYDQEGESIDLTIGISLPTITQLIKGR